MAHKEITVQDCDELFAQFMKYTETAEQHEFPKLLMIHTKLQKTMGDIHEAGKLTIDQSEVRAMFRVVLGVIGKDFSEYEEEVFKKWIPEEGFEPIGTIDELPFDIRKSSAEALINLGEKLHQILLPHLD